MKFLFENWRQYLKENEEDEFGVNGDGLTQEPQEGEVDFIHHPFSAGTEEAPWIKELRGISNEIELSRLLKGKDYKKIGGGASRTVYSHVKHDDFVVKAVSSRGSYEDHNKWDVILSRKYPNLVPKVYAHGPEYYEYAGHRENQRGRFLWIIMEKVNVIGQRDEELMYELLMVNFPEIYRFVTSDEDALSLIKASAKAKGETSEENLRVYVRDWNGPFGVWALILKSLGFGKKFFSKYDASNIRPVFSKHTQSSSAAGVSKAYKVYEQIFLLGISKDPVYMDLFKLVTVLPKLSISELRQYNIGIDKNSEFKIIDTSIFVTAPSSIHGESY